MGGCIWTPSEGYKSTAPRKEPKVSQDSTGQAHVAKISTQETEEYFRHLTALFMDPKGQPIKLLSKPRKKGIMERRPDAGTSLKEEGRTTLKTAAREIQRLGGLGMIRACSLVNWVDYIVIVTRMVFNKLKARILRRLILPYV